MKSGARQPEGLGRHPRLARPGKVPGQAGLFVAALVALVARGDESALGELPARERTLLRYQLIDGWSIDQVGKLYGVHRATDLALLKIEDDALPFVALVTAYVYFDARARLELEPRDVRTELPAEVAIEPV